MKRNSLIAALSVLVLVSVAVASQATDKIAS